MEVRDQLHLPAQVKCVTSTYQQRLMEKPYVPRSSFRCTLLGRDSDTNQSTFSRISSSTWILASCEGLSKPLQLQGGLHLPSHSLHVRGEVQGRDSAPIHKIPSPRHLNGLEETQVFTLYKDGRAPELMKEKNVEHCQKLNVGSSAVQEQSFCRVLYFK